MFGVLHRVYRGSNNKNCASCVNVAKFENSAFLSVRELISFEVLSEECTPAENDTLDSTEKRTERKKHHSHNIVWSNN